MEWFTTWWEGLEFFGQVLACAAIPGTLLLLVQTALLLIGGAAGHDSDHETDHDGSAADGGDADTDAEVDVGADSDSTAYIDLDNDGDFDGNHGADLNAVSTVIVEHATHDMSHPESGLRVFTVRGIVAFLAIGGWAGLAVWSSTRETLASAIVAAAAGTAALLFAALVIKWGLKLQESGNLIPHNAIAKMATVYIPIRPRRSSGGRVTLELQGRFVEMDAVTDNQFTIKTGETVQVVGIQGASTLVVVLVK
ncbi:hypothetical protein FACS1894219_00930 [Clostridia bacterium]|nr:hypothetical protein FACS1894219_00930 [Clostridia bacterium]